MEFRIQVMMIQKAWLFCCKKTNNLKAITDFLHRLKVEISNISILALFIYILILQSI